MSRLIRISYFGFFLLVLNFNITFTAMADTFVFSDIEGSAAKLDTLVKQGKLKWVDTPAGRRLAFVNPNDKMVFLGDLSGPNWITPNNPQNIFIRDVFLDLKAKSPNQFEFIWGNHEVNRSLRIVATVTDEDKAARAARDAKYAEYVKSLDGTSTHVVTYEELLAKAKGYRVTVLGGYSGLGYENPEAVKARMKAIMVANGDHAMYVIGGTSDGIGKGYEWIPELSKELGFKDVKTAGITSVNASKYGVAPQDYVVFSGNPATAVDDWEVKENGRSLMVKIAEDTKGKMVYLGGGGVSTAEIGEGLQRKVDVVIMKGPDLAPNAVKVAKKLQTAPNTVIDGTAQFVEKSRKHPPPQIIKETDMKNWSMGECVKNAFAAPLIR